MIVKLDVNTPKKEQQKTQPTVNQNSAKCKLCGDPDFAFSFSGWRCVPLPPSVMALHAVKHRFPTLWRVCVTRKRTAAFENYLMFSPELFSHEHRLRLALTHSCLAHNSITWWRRNCVAATSRLALRWMCDSPRTGCARRTPPIYKWRKQGTTEWPWDVISYCCLLPCRSGFPIASTAFNAHFDQLSETGSKVWPRALLKRRLRREQTSYF